VTAKGTSGIIGLAAALAISGCLPSEMGADMILRPWRRPLTESPSLPHQEIAFRNDGLRFRGWLFPATAPKRGLIVYLHGMSDTRRGAVGIASRFGPNGYDVLAYDGRAHGESDGDACTYGFFEKRDVSAALDAVQSKDAILFGSSLGAAVALQAAPGDPRVRAVIALSTFSDLVTIVAERARWFVTSWDLRDAEAQAEQRAAFRFSDASPVAAAPHIRVPVLLIHGAADNETRPEHSQRIYAALTSPKRLVLVPGAGHNDVLDREDVWQAIAQWIDGLPR
jgi:alpha-beta hydrolase superfamily lysophospholipase